MTGARFIDSLQVIALINAELSKNWPATGFTVRGPDIDDDLFIFWQDGPEAQAVFDVMGQFCGAEWNEEKQSYTRRPCEYQGALVQFDIGLVICGRLADMGRGGAWAGPERAHRIAL